LVLPRTGVIAVPDLIGVGVRPEVVDMPVGAAARPQMVREPGTKAPRTMGAADIDVEPWLKLEFAEPPDPDEGRNAR
jgi:hypothetical protein